MALTEHNNNTIPLVEVTSTGHAIAVVQTDGGAIVTPAQEGAAITGESLEAGGTHLIGWLSSIRKAITDHLPLSGGRVDVTVGTSVATTNSVGSQVDGHSLTIGSTSDDDTTSTVIGRLKKLVSLLPTGLSTGGGLKVSVADAPALTSLTANIALGESIGGAIDLRRLSVVRIEMPAGWDAANITLQECETSDGTFTNVYTADGDEYTITAAASRRIIISPADLIGGCYLKIRSGTSGTPVVQTVARIITIIARPL